MIKETSKDISEEKKSREIVSYYLSDYIFAMRNWLQPCQYL